MVHLSCGAASDVGRVRTVNQDAWLAVPPVFVVADGMGGHHGGEVASGIVVEEFARLAEAGYDRRDPVPEVSACLAECQRRILAYAAEAGAPGEHAWYAGTTVVAALACEDDAGPTWLLVNLGDSRIYRLLDDELERVTVDHSLVQELVDAGVIDENQAARHPERHVVTRALGGPEWREPDFFMIPMTSAPRLLLCSDGVTGMLSDEELARVLGSAEDSRDAAVGVVVASVEAGGEDNTTAVVVDVVGWSDAGPVVPRPASPLNLERRLGDLP